MGLFDPKEFCEIFNKTMDFNNEWKVHKQWKMNRGKI